MKNNKGFTLIEIMTVVLIIGVLSAIALPQYRRVMQKSYATQAIAMLRSINDSSERLAVEFGYKSFANLAGSNVQSIKDKAKFSRMDMFSEENLPGDCEVDDETNILNCPVADQLKAFSYKAHVSAGGKNYIVAKKRYPPYENTYILFDRADSSLSCKPGPTADSPACDVFGLNETSVNVSF